MKTLTIITFAFILIVFSSVNMQCQDLNENTELDKKVKNFLDKKSGRWYDMNVPKQDGKLLYDIIIKNNYKSALEIGTSTGHSSIWIAWALSKTGGKLITIDIDESRRKEALQNIKEAGLEKYIDSRLADAHDLVKKLPGPFDFVFSDADKDWYKNYFIAIDPKLVVNGCYTSHNVSEKRHSNTPASYLEFLKKLPNYKTTVNEEGGGMSISYKVGNK